MLICTPQVLNHTLAHIRVGAANNCETVVLWLGRRSCDQQYIVEAFRPEQVVDRDFFKIPAFGMRQLLAYLREARVHILAQVHSHPREAFHSLADDAWAVVRHVGAISLVVPWFGVRSRTPTFLDDIAAFQLDASDRWRQVDPCSVVEVRPDVS